MTAMSSALRAWRAVEHRWQSWPPAVRQTSRLMILVALLALGTLIVYVTGGTRYAYPYLMLIPVLLAGAWYTWRGSLLVALMAGLLMAAMPLTVASGEAQATLNWVIRLCLYLAIGAFAGVLFERLRQSH
ncbi:MAG: hypothetical protein ACRC3F_20615, partial [Billgrantia desiderata]